MASAGQVDPDSVIGFLFVEKRLRFSSVDDHAALLLGFARKEFCQGHGIPPGDRE